MAFRQFQIKNRKVALADISYINRGVSSKKV